MKILGHLIGHYWLRQHRKLLQQKQLVLGQVEAGWVLSGKWLQWIGQVRVLGLELEQI